MQIGTKGEATMMYRDLMTRVCRGIMDGTLESTIDDLPKQIFKDGQEPKYFDTLEKEREVCHRQLQSIIGEKINPADPPTKPLSQSLKETLSRKKEDYVPGAVIIPEACKRCGPSKVMVTDACEGCVARPCMTNCPKKAISRVDGKAVIDQSKCIACGMCVKVCPYGAIIKKRVPCMDDCPVDAISKDSENRSVIDPAKCIHCGRCTVRCPFGAAIMPSEVVDVVSRIKQGKKVIAMLAPAVLGQFNGTPAQINQACLKSGFSEMVEVALGADTTSFTETKEFLEEVAPGKQRLLATSCCPAWVRCAQVHIPGIAPFVSHTQSPMVYTGDLCKKRDPECVTVFVGPCTAKRTEALMKENTDFVLTAEELSCIFAANDADVMKMPKEDPKKTRASSAEASYYCASQGVTQAVVQAVPKAADAIKKEGHEIDEKAAELKPVFVSPLDKASFKKIKGWGAKPDSTPGNLIEVMCCDGGCIAGPGNIAAPLVGIGRVKRLLPERPKFNDIEDVLSL
ncbi:[FeFe]-hydrogenase [Monocercomonoides exilis]|uniref:[FeFe]-hydrogenase n=1 Tax=Monocercomonoides exilis TaxID=2049356 RepID=UPI00355A4517|nr:[FeFe]-hydrogenase [Monocercomonoides exilis]|eukprot:MONOS_13381.1-p1 / transcript=MONOS_13381.1 / gene=MONOS_13381 / organism=Monocercomonoides_exilis_PA203 / gene_product=[FeFe]-hydrogenase / transcript_product=[FeFe]-hydrogenase / location=Mono_scaffold00819:7357-8959(-) / protein_length=512 / sequence_SO=supercontig / SO=protein_coding / is_pseudo=false